MTVVEYTFSREEFEQKLTTAAHMAVRGFARQQGLPNDEIEKFCSSHAVVVVSKRSLATALLHWLGPTPKDDTANMVLVEGPPKA